ncbi:MAG TPA: hypothetical protein VLI54_01515 [Bacillota bacterium]|nr:hypothetical protein [Bacillota bacterium]
MPKTNHCKKIYSALHRRIEEKLSFVKNVAAIGENLEELIDKAKKVVREKR